MVTKLKIYLDIIIEPKNTLIIFDEIQACPNALNSLKYFCEEAPEYHVASAGSLLGIKLARGKGFPVGKVDFLQLYPMTFLEFISAIGKERLRDYLTECKAFTAISQPFHNQLIEYLKYYFYVGGMPEAVQCYLDNQDFQMIREIQLSIIEAYQMDFGKYQNNAVDVAKITEVWQAIPMQLAKENKKFIFSAIRKSARGRDFDAAIQWLSDANLIVKSLLLPTPQLPMKAYADERIFKVYVNDVGLLSAMNDITAKELLTPKNIFKEFYGALTENYVAQELTANGQKQLFYWSSQGRAELDFIASYEGNIYPLEVKAGESKRKKSLLIYRDKYKPKFCARSSLMNYRLDADIANFPLYLVWAFPTAFGTLS